MANEIQPVGVFLAEEKNPKENTCEWKTDKYDEDRPYYTSCENIFCILEGTPSENDMAFCPFCGKKIEEV